MKISELKKHLASMETVDFWLENGDKVESHFHVTEVGLIEKHFIDCGGVIRNERKISLQLWTSSDWDHRLKADKFRKIIAMSESKLHLTDEEIEVEYQQDTIGKFNLSLNEKGFLLMATQTACLASDACGISESKPKIRLSMLKSSGNSCAEGSGCCN